MLILTKNQNSKKKNERAKREQKEVVSDRNLESIQSILETAEKTLDNEYDESVASLVATRGITRETMKMFRVGVLNWRFYLDEFSEEVTPGVLYPWYNVVRGKVVLRRFKVFILDLFFSYNCPFFI